MKLCSCISAATTEECIKLAKTVDTELIEHRIDFMEGVQNLGRIYDAVTAPIIATNRSATYGGHFYGSEEKRVRYLLKAIDAGCTMVDVEIETDVALQQNVLEKARRNKCNVIISMHDFNRTPGREKLVEILHREKEEGADIGKIVTLARSIEDCHRILDLLMEARQERFPLVAFAMGDAGSFTRIAALLYGAPFMYASVTEKTGPGQLSVTAMRTILGELHGTIGRRRKPR